MKEFVFGTIKNDPFSVKSPDYRETHVESKIRSFINTVRQDLYKTIAEAITSNMCDATLYLFNRQAQWDFRAMLTSHVKDSSP